MKKVHTIKVIVENDADKQRVNDIVEKLFNDKSSEIGFWQDPDNALSGVVFVDFDVYMDSYYGEVLEALKAAKPFSDVIDMGLYSFEVPDEFNEVTIREDAVQDYNEK